MVILVAIPLFVYLFCILLCATIPSIYYGMDKAREGAGVSGDHFTLLSGTWRSGGIAARAYARKTADWKNLFLYRSAKPE